MHGEPSRRILSSLKTLFAHFSRSYLRQTCVGGCFICLPRGAVLGARPAQLFYRHFGPCVTGLFWGVIALSNPLFSSDETTIYTSHPCLFFFSTPQIDFYSQPRLVNYSSNAISDTRTWAGLNASENYLFDLVDFSSTNFSFSLVFCYDFVIFFYNRIESGIRN